MTRAYGPHDPTEGPETVTVLAAEPWPAPVLRPLPAALARQRRDLNNRAWEGTQ